ncbi:hypothetical protein B0H14DRAFT_3617188 [Mycena olivaceomarginata]|nr:hypothetical protein B0H14DRAFT_3617188 [Mycena olivaceomarginata]
MTLTIRPSNPKHTSAASGFFVSTAVYGDSTHQATKSVSSVIAPSARNSERGVDSLGRGASCSARLRAVLDVYVALVSNDGADEDDDAHDKQMPVFSSHRFILASCSSYFHTALVSWPASAPSKSLTSDVLTLTLPSPRPSPPPLFTSPSAFSHRHTHLLPPHLRPRHRPRPPRRGPHLHRLISARAMMRAAVVCPLLSARSGTTPTPTTNPTPTPTPRNAAAIQISRVLRLHVPALMYDLGFLDSAPKTYMPAVWFGPGAPLDTLLVNDAPNQKGARAPTDATEAGVWIAMDAAAGARTWGPRGRGRGF